MRIPAIQLLLLLLLGVSNATYVHGSIYTAGSPEPVNNTVITIRGPFSYQLVASGADYSFDLPQGNYTISARYFDGQGKLALFAEERVQVGAQDQNIDLVLQPVQPDLSVLLVAGFAVAVSLLALALYFTRKKTAPPEKPAAKPEAPLDEDSKTVLSVLARNDFRMTQKELCEQLRYSDAKLSLILTELESTGYVKKFKRGRGNVVKLLKQD